MQEIGKFDVKVSAISKGLDKHMAFTINRNLFFIDSMQFMNSSLDELVRNLSELDFKYSSQNMNGELKGVYPCEYINSFKIFLMINCLIDVNFLAL